MKWECREGDGGVVKWVVYGGADMKGKCVGYGFGALCWEMGL